MAPEDPPPAAKRRGPRTYMRRTYHLALTQEALQMNWSLYRQQRHRDYRTTQGPGTRHVDWTDTVAVLCGECRRKLGNVVAFHAGDLYGIVDDRAGDIYGRTSPVLTGRQNNRPYWLWITGDGRKALARIRCPRCKHDHQRNAHRLGHQIVQHSLAEIPIS